MTEDLKALVGQLSNLSNKDDIVSKLQEINQCFLQKYMLDISGFKIYPVEVEIYYYKEINNKIIFNDGLCHKNKLQNGFVDNNKERFGKIYFHRMRNGTLNTGQGGIDVCLSLGNYFLSILIRSAYINGKIECGINKILQKVLEIEQFAKVTDELKKKYSEIEGKSNILKERDNKIYNSFISHPRIKGKKYFYEIVEYENNKYPLNTLICDELKNLKSSPYFYTIKRKKDIENLLSSSKKITISCI